MKAYITTFFLLSFAFNAHAKSIPAFTGKIENLTQLATESLEIEIRGVCMVGDLGCGMVTKNFKVAQNGEFKTTAIKIPNSMWPLSTFSYSAYVKGKDLFWEFPASDKVKFYDLTLFEIPEQTLRISLKNGGDAAVWMKEALPESKLNFNLSLHGADMHPLGYEIASSFHTSMTKPELKVKQQFVVVNKEVMASKPLKLSLQYMTTLRKTIFNYSEPVASLESVLAPVEHVMIDSDLAFDYINGDYTGLLLLHDLGPLIKMAVANSLFNMKLTCRNGVLGGMYENFWNKEGTEIYDVLASKGEIHGTCTNYGKGEFSLNLPLKAYLGETILTRKLNFIISGVDARKMGMTVIDDELKKAGGYLYQR